MKINVQKYNQIAVLSIQGEFTRESVKTFEDVSSSLLAEPEGLGIIIDMSKAVLLDSTTLETLLDFNEQCHKRLRQLKLVGLDETCRKILEITRLLGLFDTYDGLAEAVKSYA